MPGTGAGTHLLCFSPLPAGESARAGREGLVQTLCLGKQVPVPRTGLSCSDTPAAGWCQSLKGAEVLVLHSVPWCQSAAKEQPRLHLHPGFWGKESGKDYVSSQADRKKLAVWQWVWEWAGAQLPAPQALHTRGRGLLQAVFQVLEPSLPGIHYISMAAASPEVT